MEINSTQKPDDIVLALPDLLLKVGKEEFKYHGVAVLKPGAVKRTGGIYHILKPDAKGEYSGSFTTKRKGTKADPVATWVDGAEAAKDVSKFGPKVSFTSEQQTALRTGKTIEVNGVKVSYNANAKPNAQGIKEPFTVSGRPSKNDGTQIVETFKGTKDEIESLIFDTYRG